MKAGSCLHELIGTGCEARVPNSALQAKRGKGVVPGPSRSPNLGLGLDIQEVRVGTGRASPACLGPPNLGWTDGVRRSRKSLPADSGE